MAGCAPNTGVDLGDILDPMVKEARAFRDQALAEMPWADPFGFWATSFQALDDMQDSIFSMMTSAS